MADANATEPTDLDGIPCRRLDSRLKPQTAYHPAAESEFTDLLCSAKCKARPEIKAIKKNAKGNFGPYATLDEVIDAVCEALPKYGLDLSSKTIIIGDEQWLVSTLRHTSGQFERSFSRLTERVPQKVLSEVTYYRRKDYACLCGVAADSDLDGAGLEGAKPTKKTGPSALNLARSALVSATTEHDRDQVVARAAMSVVAGRMTEDEMSELKSDRAAMPPCKPAAPKTKQEAPRAE
jgi:hypothetical protein